MKWLFTILFILLIADAFCQFGAGVAQYTSTNAIKFGVLVNSDVLSNTQKAHVAKDTLGCLWARTAAVTSQWNGSSNRYETYDNLGILQSVNFSYSPNASGDPFPTGTTLTNFLDTAQLFVNKYPNLGMFVYLNEELNQSYHTGSITSYYQGLQAVYNKFHPQGIIVTNGGLAGSGLDISVYRWLVTKYGQSAADQYGAGTMTNAQINAAKTPNSNPTLEAAVRQIDTALMYSAYVDYWNLHIYEVLSRTNTQPDTVTQITPNAWRYQVEFMTAQSGKPVITNETGQRDNTQPNLVTNMLANYLRIGTAYMFWFNGDDGSAGAKSLTDPTTGAIQPNGTAFRNYIIANQSKNWAAQ